MTKVEHTLDPLFDRTSRILILGTMPSPKSRQAGFYYAHPQNRFWPVMENLFHVSLPTIAEKRVFCLQHHIALYDVLASCEIQGASDQSIRKAIPNDLKPLLENSEIHTIFTTGTKAYALYRRYLEKEIGIPAILLPSTSPANAAKSLADLIEAYCVILEHL